MPQALSIDWGETEKACLAGVPVHQVAKAMAERAGLPVKRVYQAIRQRISRERWPIPDSIVRRARAQARVAAGLATNAKEASAWNAGKSGLEAVQESREIAGVVPVALGSEAGPMSPDEIVVSPGAEGLSGASAGAGLSAAEDVRGAFSPVPVTAAELVTADLSQLGQRGLRAILSTAVNAAESMQQAPDIRSWNDVQVMTKVISQAAGLDKPGVAIAVSLNNATNATIAGWTDAETIEAIG
jgi:hypothetical protein